jgi:predicted Zn finger-like uncharacterized protein
MRLICPNCDAQYEVPDDVMPVSGRDVQCSNCGQTWFQHHPDHLPDENPNGLGDSIPTPDEETATPAPPPEQSKPAPERKQLDPSVADILRQEAEAEQEARRARQVELLESQPDLGLDGAAKPSEDERARLAKERMARLRGEESRRAPQAAAASAAGLGSRRDLLPDIEEINSTLRTGNERRSADPDLENTAVTSKSKRKGGFKRGFVIVVALASLLVLGYVFAPQISKAVPQAEPYMTRYVAAVNQGRVSLDSSLQNTLQWLDDKASKSGS